MVNHKNVKLNLQYRIDEDYYNIELDVLYFHLDGSFVVFPHTENVTICVHENTQVDFEFAKDGSWVTVDIKK